MWAIVGWTDAHKYLKAGDDEPPQSVQYLTTEEFLSNKYSADITKFLLLSSFFHYSPDEQQKKISEYRAKIQELALAHKHLDIVYLSSASVYGLSKDETCRFAETAPTCPLDRNGQEKVEIENLLFTLCRTHQSIKLLIIRCSGFFGKKNFFHNSRNFIDSLIEKKREALHDPVIVSDNGQQIRDFLYVFDLINILKILITSWPSCFSETEPNIINIATTKKYRIHEIMSLISPIQDVSYLPSDKEEIHNALNTVMFHRCFPNYKLTTVEEYIFDQS